MGRLDAESETLIPTIGGVFDVAHATAIRTANTSSNGHGFNDEVAYTLDRTQVQAVAFAHQAGGIQTTLGHDPEAGTSPTLAKCQTPAVAIAFAQNQRDEVRVMQVVGTLAAEPGAKQQTYAQIGMAVRRLTPTECERLQGFPDGYTDIRRGGKATPDGPRYKVLGNSMAIPPMRWLGQRIALVDSIQALQAAA